MACTEDLSTLDMFIGWIQFVSVSNGINTQIPLLMNKYPVLDSTCIPLENSYKPFCILES